MCSCVSDRGALELGMSGYNTETLNRDHSG
jgi:hypothetical protein